MDETVKQRIESLIANHKIMIFMKGTTENPECGFSNQIVQIFKVIGMPFTTENILVDEALRSGIKEFSNWPTIPQIYVNGEFLGGCDIVTEMYQNGELQTLLEKAVA